MTCYIFSTPEPCVIWMSLSLTHTLIDHLFFSSFSLLFISLSLSFFLSGEEFSGGGVRYQPALNTLVLISVVFIQLLVWNDNNKKKRKQKFISQFYFFNFNFRYFDNYNRIFSYNPLLFFNFFKNLDLKSLLSLWLLLVCILLPVQPVSSFSRSQWVSPPQTNSRNEIPMYYFLNYWLFYHLLLFFFNNCIYLFHSLIFFFLNHYLIPFKFHR